MILLHIDAHFYQLPRASHISLLALDVILLQMHPDQFFRMSYLWSAQRALRSRRVGAVRVYPISGSKANGLGDQGLYSRFLSRANIDLLCP